MRKPAIDMTMPLTKDGIPKSQYVHKRSSLTNNVSRNLENLHSQKVDNQTLDLTIENENSKNNRNIKLAPLENKL